MSIMVEWDNESQTAVRMVYEGTWNWRDHFLALDAVSALMSMVLHPVDLILDLQNSMPLADSTAWHVAHPHKALHECWSGRTTIISPDGEMARVMLNATNALARQQDAELEPC